MYPLVKTNEHATGEPLQPLAQPVIRHRQTVLGCAGEVLHEHVAGMLLARL